MKIFYDLNFASNEVRKFKLCKCVPQNWNESNLILVCGWRRKTPSALSTLTDVCFLLSWYIFYYPKSSLIKSIKLFDLFGSLIVIRISLNTLVIKTEYSNGKCHVWTWRKKLCWDNGQVDHSTCIPFLYFKHSWTIIYWYNRLLSRTMYMFI